MIVKLRTSIYLLAFLIRLFRSSRLSWNSQFFCHSFPTVGIIGVCHQTQLMKSFLFKNQMQFAAGRVGVHLYPGTVKVQTGWSEVRSSWDYRVWPCLKRRKERGGGGREGRHGCEETCRGFHSLPAESLRWLQCLGRAGQVTLTLSSLLGCPLDSAHAVPCVGNHKRGGDIGLLKFCWLWQVFIKQS